VHTSDILITNPSTTALTYLGSRKIHLVHTHPEEGSFRCAANKVLKPTLPFVSEVREPASTRGPQTNRLTIVPTWANSKPKTQNSRHITPIRSLPRHDLHSKYGGHVTSQSIDCLTSKFLDRICGVDIGEAVQTDAKGQGYPWNQLWLGG